MSKATWINANGTWKKCKAVWLNVGGVWKKIIDKVNVIGIWKDCISYIWNKVIGGFGVYRMYINNGYIYIWQASNLRTYNDSADLILTETDKYIVMILTDGSDIYKISSNDIYKNNTNIFHNTSYTWSYGCIDSISKKLVLVKENDSYYSDIVVFSTSGSYIGNYYTSGIYMLGDIYTYNDEIYFSSSYSTQGSFSKVKINGVNVAANSGSTIFEVTNIFPDYKLSNHNGIRFTIYNGFAYCIMAGFNQIAKIDITNGNKTIYNIESNVSVLGIVGITNSIVTLVRTSSNIKLIKYDLNCNKISEKITTIDDFSNISARSLNSDVSNIYYSGIVANQATLFKDDI